MSRTDFTPAEKKLVSNSTDLSFMVSFDGTTSIYQYEIFQKNIVDALRARATTLGISTKKKWPLEGIGATGGELILQAIIDFYHNYEAWFTILKIIGVIPTIKMIVTKLVSAFNWVRFRLTYPFQPKQENSLRLVVSVRAEVDVSDYNSDDSHGHLYEIKNAMNDLLLLVPIFKGEVESIIGTMPISFSLTSKAISSDTAIAIHNYSPDSKAIKKRTFGFMKKATYKHTTYSIGFYKTRFLGILRMYKYKDGTIF